MASAFVILREYSGLARQFSLIDWAELASGYQVGTLGKFDYHHPCQQQY